MAQAVIRRPLNAETRVRVRVAFVVDKVALGQSFLQVVRFSPVSIIPPWLSIVIIWRGEQQAGLWPLFRHTV
jgi:hypothetical protein